MKTNQQKRKTTLLAVVLAVAVCLPLRARAQNGMFDHEDYGGPGTELFTHEYFGNDWEGNFTHEYFGNAWEGNFTHEFFGNNWNGTFGHEGFGDDFDGDFNHEGFGAPLGSGLLVLTLAGVGYAGIKRRKLGVDS